MEDTKIITMPVIALRGLTMLPEMTISFDISRKKSIAAVEKAMVGDQRVCLVAQKDPEIMDPSLDQLYHIGTVSYIKQLVKMPGGIVRVMAEGQERAELLDLDSTEPSLMGEVLFTQEQEADVDGAAAEAMSRILKEKLESYGHQHPKFAKEILPGMMVCEDLESLMLKMASDLPWDYRIRQAYLEEATLAGQYEVLLSNLIHEIEVSQIHRELQEKVKENIDKNQKDYILREQLKVIREELGEDPLSDADEYEKQLASLKADKEVKEKLQKEIDRLKGMPGGGQESNVIRTYIETLLELPWNKISKDNNDIRHAKQILEEDHYGLEQVKERVLEYLAVRVLAKKGNSPIICLVGPPGTGKTSIARSVARALNKKYVRISLGGVHDEAEIRGHRKTYVGAMPGRLVDGLRQAGVSNPLMLLDEIDKVSSDYKGDTSSALLEVLDGEQNVKFRDHYVELPIDLSNVLFIATANTTQTIPGPLLDRMEIIEINTYTQNEKLHIAKEHLIEKQMKANGIKAKQLTITDGAIENIILYYTREAGVRGLERCLGDICRKTARMILQDGKKNVKVTEKNLEHFLGTKKYDYEMANAKNEIGIVRGLAWTSVGGDTLEVNVMPGKGKFELTGHLGDVMKESAMAAISYIRSVSDKFNIDKEFFEKNDIHIHIPEGAVPKDGPSAGVTMATAMLSAITGIPVRADVAMTGEITLRGRVLPIGGLREKSIAAKVAGIHTVIVPEKNRRDIRELDKEITKDMKFVYAATMADILPVALESMPKAQAANS